MSNSKILMEKRAGVHSQMTALAEKIKTEKRNFNEEEKAAFDSYDREQDGLSAEIESFERIERIEGLTRSQSQNRIREEVLSYQPKTNAGVEERNKAVAGWMYHGTPKARPEFWRAAERQGIEVSCPTLRMDWLPWNKPQFDVYGRMLPETRGGNFTSPGSSGGDTIAVDNRLMTDIDVAMKFYGNVFQWADVIDTPTGAPLPWPTNDDTGNTGETIGEGSGPSESSLTFGQNSLSAYVIDSNIIKVSVQLMQDSVLDMASFLGKQLGERLGRRLNTELVVGNTSSITPLLTSVTVGQTTASSPTAISYADLIALYESVDIAYSSNPACGWVFSQNFRAALRNLVDQNLRPLLFSSLEGIATTGLPTALLDKPYYLNQAIPTIASAHQVALFGQLDKFKVRRVTGDMDGGLNLVRLNERYMADTMQIGFFVWGRFDGLLSDAGQHPIKTLKMHS